MANVSLYESKYEGSDGIERDSRFNGNYIVNATYGKEFPYNKKGKDYILGVNLRVNYMGGLRETPIDEIASEAAGITIFNEAEAYSLKQKDVFKTDLRIYWKRNKKKFNSTLALDIQNVTNTQNESFKYYGAEDLAMGFSLKKNAIRICYAPLAKADHYDEVEIERYRIKFTEAGREGVKLILSMDRNFFNNSNFRFLLPINKKDNLISKSIKILISFFFNSYLEKILRNIAKFTNSVNFLFSNLLFHILFSCWMFRGLNSKKSSIISNVQYKN